MGLFLQLVLQGLALGTAYALVGQGLNVTFWTTRVLNFGHGALLMTAVYLALVGITNGVPLIVSLLLAVALTALIGLVIEAVAVRPALKIEGGMSWIVATLGAGIVLEGVAEIAFGPEVRAFPGSFFPSDSTVRLGGVSLSTQLLVVSAICLAVLGLFELVMRRTVWGKVLKATSKDRDLAALRGINVPMVIRVSFMLSAALAALAGVLVAPITGVSPSFGFALLLNGFAAAVVGGVGNSFGTLVGGLTVGVAELLVGGYISSAAQGGVAFALLLVILMVRPNGLFGKREVVKV